MTVYLSLFNIYSHTGDSKEKFFKKSKKKKYIYFEILSFWEVFLCGGENTYYLGLCKIMELYVKLRNKNEFLWILSEKYLII